MTLDKTSVNIVSLVLGLGVVAGALWSFNSPFLHKSFYGTNLFLLKRDHIHAHQARLFAGLTALVVMLQVAAEIGAFSDRRLFTPIAYLGIALASLAFAAVGIWSLIHVARSRARREWMPIVLDEQREDAQRLAQFLTNGGFYDSQLEQHIQNNESERARVLAANEVQVLGLLEILESQLDYRARGGARARAMRYLEFRSELAKKYGK